VPAWSEQHTRICRR